MRAIIHMKSRKQVPILFTWTAWEWAQWLHRSQFMKDKLEDQVIFVCDERGTQYAIPAANIDFVMVPLDEEDENDGK